MGSEERIRSEAVYAALGALGKPYNWGGQGPGSFDCSGLVLWSWEQAGIKWADTTANGLWNLCERVERPKPGDLAFYGREGRITHVEICLGWRGTWVMGANSGGPPLQGETKKGYRMRMLGRNACVKIEKGWNHRRDFVSFGSLPWEESTHV